jgi:homoserine kinase
VLAGLKAEAAVSGYHADNIAPALLGGFIIVRCRHDRLRFPQRHASSKGTRQREPPGEPHRVA